MTPCFCPYVHNLSGQWPVPRKQLVVILGGPSETAPSIHQHLTAPSSLQTGNDHISVSFSVKFWF